LSKFCPKRDVARLFRKVPLTQAKDLQILADSHPLPTFAACVAAVISKNAGLTK
jgi:hypothetical protein